MMPKQSTLSSSSIPVPTKGLKALDLQKCISRLGDDIRNLESLTCRLYGQNDDHVDAPEGPPMAVVTLLDTAPGLLVSFSERLRECIRRLEEGLI